MLSVLAQWWAHGGLAFALALLAATMPGQAQSLRVQPFDLPPGFTVARVASGLRINGLAVEVYAVQTAEAPELAATRVAQSWARESTAPPPLQQQAGPWALLSRHRDTRAQALQLQPAAGGGSAGYLSEIDLAAAPGPLPRPALPLPASARLVSVTESHDAGIEARQFSYWVPLSPLQALQELRRTITRGGWQVMGESLAALAQRAQGDAELLLALQRGADDLQLVLARAPGGSSLVINQRHRDAGWR